MTINGLSYTSYLGTQCCYCGKEDYTPRYVCPVCDDLACHNCLGLHANRHQSPTSSTDTDQDGTDA